MLQAIIGFHQDEEEYWVAKLACKHTQRVRITHRGLIVLG